MSQAQSDGTGQSGLSGSCPKPPTRLPKGGRPGRMPALRTECGDFSMRIARDGSWHYKGSPIGRKELVCLFASVLKREADGSFWLETPVERGRIEVEDAPFVAVEMWWRSCADPCTPAGATEPRQCLTFRTNLDEMVTADADHPIRVAIDPRTREPRPYITVRPGLEARINRAVFYELVALAEPERIEGRDVLGVWSEGVFFPIDDVPNLACGQAAE
ncbi:DUF1285 domain-containing protein [Roseomonas sp. F4]